MGYHNWHTPTAQCGRDQSPRFSSFFMHLFIPSVFVSDPNRLNNVKLCLIILTCIAEVRHNTSSLSWSRIAVKLCSFWKERVAFRGVRHILMYISIISKSNENSHGLSRALLFKTALVCEFAKCILRFMFQDQYANSLMHDVNMNFRVPLHKMVRKKYTHTIQKFIVCSDAHTLHTTCLFTYLLWTYCFKLTLVFSSAHAT